MIEKIRNFYSPVSSAYPLRKETVIAHWVFGAICAYLLTQSAILSLILMLGFAFWEMWNDSDMFERDCDYLPEGSLDFWDSFVIFISGLVLILILSPFGITALKW